jgi:hypothetical protein
MRVRIGLLLALLAASLLMASPAGATPTPPVLVVNHSTRQCAEVIQGDDCHWCEQPEGWELLGYSSQATCPDGYENLGYQGMSGECVGYKSRFCCSDSAHHGDCEDLVINKSEQLCAFVEEISGCTLPEGWTSAADTTQWSGRCPFGNQWVPDIACVATPEAAEPTAIAPTAATTPDTQDRFRPGIVWGAAVALGGLLAAAVWLILKRPRRR